MSATDPRLIQLPPIHTLPEDAQPAAERFLQLRDALEAADRDREALSRKTAAAIPRAEQARADAVRAGKDPASVDDGLAALAAQQTAAEQNVAAHARALSDEWLTGALRRGLLAHVTDQTARWQAERDTRTQGVQDASQALIAAQSRWLRAAQMQAFWARLGHGMAPMYGGISIRQGDLQPFNGYSAAEPAESITRASEYLDRHSTIATPEATPDPEPQPKPRKTAPARLR